MTFSQLGKARKQNGDSSYFTVQYWKNNIDRVENKMTQDAEDLLKQEPKDIRQNEEDQLSYFIEKFG